MPRKGIPIGNLTSQIFANIYLNEFDQYIKHALKIKNYARYTDDFILVANDEAYLRRLLPSIQEFLSSYLQLILHSHKVHIQPAHRGVDFLGYIIFPHYRLLRTRTRQRMFKKIKQGMEERNEGRRTDQSLYQVIQSYLGVLSHANTHKLSRDLRSKGT